MQGRLVFLGNSINIYLFACNEKYNYENALMLIIISCCTLYSIVQTNL